jgi:hypothetical protein
LQGHNAIEKGLEIGGFECMLPWDSGFSISLLGLSRRPHRDRRHLRLDQQRQEKNQTSSAKSVHCGAPGTMGSEDSSS